MEIILGLIANFFKQAEGLFDMGSLNFTSEQPDRPETLTVSITLMPNLSAVEVAKVYSALGDNFTLEAMNGLTIVGKLKTK